MRSQSEVATSGTYNEAFPKDLLITIFNGAFKALAHNHEQVAIAVDTIVAASAGHMKASKIVSILRVKPRAAIIRLGRTRK